MTSANYRFSGVLLDTARRQLRIGDTVRDVSPQVFDTLEFLVTNSEQVVSKDEMAAALWSERVVTDASVAQAIRKVRAVLEECGLDADIIRTRHGHGYEFACAVEVLEAEDEAPTDAATSGTTRWWKHPFRTGAVVAVLGGILVTAANITEILGWLMPDDSIELLTETQTTVESTDAKVDELVQLLRMQAAMSGNTLDPASESTIRDAIGAIVTSVDARKQVALDQLSAGDIDAAGASLIAVAEDLDAASNQSLDAAVASWREAGAVYYSVNIAEAVRSYEAAYRLRPDDPVSSIDLAFAYLRAGQLDAARERFDGATNAESPLVLRATASRGAGAVSKIQGEFAAAKLQLEQALQLAIEAGDQRERGLTLLQLGAIAREQGENDVARQYFESTVDIGEETADRHLLADALNGLGIVMAVSDEFDAAAEVLLRVLEIHTDRQDLAGQATALGNLGANALRSGDADSAEDWLVESVAVGERLGWQRSIAFDLINLGGIAATRGEYDLAESRLAEALEIAQDLGMGEVIPIILVNLGEVARDRGDEATACEYWREALPALRGMQHGAVPVVEQYRRNLDCP